MARNRNAAARAALDDIARWPRLHAEDADGFRRQRLSRFPYAFVYHVEDDDRAHVFVLEHLRRWPGYWHERLNDPPDL